MGWRALLPEADEPDTSRERLALGVELRQREAYDPGRWDPRRVDTVTPRALARSADELQLAVRPLVAGTRGGWIRGDATWDTVRRSVDRFDARQVAWFAELHGIAAARRTTGPFSAVADWLVLDTVESAHLWRHLAAAGDLDIPLVAAAAAQDVRLGASASAELVVAPASGGALRLRARVRVDGVERDPALVRPIGRSGVYTIEVDRDPIPIVLAPVELPEAVAALLGTDGVTVPAAETAEFLAEAYPRLARRGAVAAEGGLTLPALTRPTLRVRVHFRPQHTIDYDLVWSYPGAAALGYAPEPHPDRDPDAEERIRARVEHAWTATADGAFAASGSLRDAEAAAFASHVLPALDALDDVRVESTGKRPAYRELEGDPAITVTTVPSPDPDWFDLGIVVTIDGRTIPFGALFTALARGRRRLMLSDGAYFSLAHPALDRLKELLDEAAGLAEWETGPRIARTHVALWTDFEDLADIAEPAVAWRELVDGLRDVDHVPPTPLPAALRAELRPYQRAGFDWLAFLWRQRLGGILADDMGLGKTLQTLCLLAHTREAGERRPALVVAPTSVLATWGEEAARFLPGLRVHTVDGTRARTGRAVADAASDADVVVTSYALLRLDADDYAAVDWAVAVLDEAQFVKNPRTKLHRAAAALRTDAVFAITGTPLENSLTDLWALLSLTAPGLFPSARRFREEFVGPIERASDPAASDLAADAAARAAARRTALLRRRIRPFVLRRTKELVAPELPPRQEQDVHVQLSPGHRALYDTVLQRERQKVLGLLDDLDRQRFIVFRSLTLLRMLSLAPGLLDERDAGLGSAKLDALVDRLVEVVREGHRALVFSQFTSFLRLAGERLEAAGLAYAYLDGSTTGRAEVVSQFRAGEAPVFLISLKAGGFGLTLTEADYVFLLDPWWNPAAEAQAIDRVHRIGQDRSVFVYRLIAADTIEEKVTALQRRKGELFQAVLDDGDPFAGTLDADDIRGLFEA